MESAGVHVQASLCSLLPILVTPLTVTPAVKMQQHVCDVSAQGSLLETQCPRVLWDSGHIGSLCLAPTEIPDSQRKTSVQHKPYCLQKRSRHREPHSPVWESFFCFCFGKRKKCLKSLLVRFYTTMEKSYSI